MDCEIVISQLILWKMDIILRMSNSEWNLSKNSNDIFQK